VVLYKNIIQFWKSESAKNITCPKPVVPKCEKDVVIAIPTKRKYALLM